MKNFSPTPIMIASVLAALCHAIPVPGQAPVIASFGQNGLLVCTNLLPGTTATVEWASSVLGPWTNTWAGLDAVTADSNGSIRVSVPMFYRVRVVPPFPAPSNMVWIPAGTFVMGSPDDEPARGSYEGPQTVVTISRGFCMGKYEVTQGEYSAVMGSNPSFFQGGNLPVETVSWYDAVAYCAALTARERSAGGCRRGMFIGCRRRRSGSMHAGRERRRRSVTGMIRATPT